MLVEPVHLFVPSGTSVLRISSHGFSKDPTLVRYWAKHAPTKISKVWWGPLLEQRPQFGTARSDQFHLEGLRSYWLAIIAFQYNNGHWSRTPLISEKTKVVPALELVFGNSDVTAASEPRVQVDVEYG